MNTTGAPFLHAFFSSHLCYSRACMRGPGGCACARGIRDLMHMRTGPISITTASFPGPVRSVWSVVHGDGSALPPCAYGALPGIQRRLPRDAQIRTYICPHAARRLMISTLRCQCAVTRFVCQSSAVPVPVACARRLARLPDSF